MIRSLYRIALLLCCLALPALAAERTDKKTASLSPDHKTAKPSVALAPSADTSEDWQLPSFEVTDKTPAHAAPSPSLSHLSHAKSSTASAKPAAVPARKEDTAAKSGVPSTKMEVADTHQPPPTPETKSPAKAPLHETPRQEAAALKEPAQKVAKAAALEAKTPATVATSKHSLPIAETNAFETPTASAAPAKPAPKTSVASEKATMSGSVARAAISTVLAAKKELGVVENRITGRLARLTAYWAGEGDYYTGRCLSSTGIHLHGGHCAVDPSIIPYGSVVEIPGVGQFLAVDTGSAVISRAAAREAGHTREERGALVIDLFFEHRAEGERFAASGAKFVDISWWTPSSTGSEAQHARRVFADEDWNKIYSKQL
jgi:3D (Asp-Asp-Asp) domain-containing protein